jgi:hypothetical protein
MTRAAVLMAAALFAIGCGDDTPTSPSSTDTTATTSSITFTGTLAPGGSRFYSFSATAAGSVSALLASVATAATGLPLGVPLEIGVGVPAGTGCAATTTQMVSPGLTAQLSVPLETGTFCLRVADAGFLTSPATFAVRFTHP